MDKLYWVKFVLLIKLASLKNLGSIFHPFISFKEKGIGLGLSVLKALVDEHDGGIVVRCVVDKFTKIGIFLPCNRSI